MYLKLVSEEINNNNNKRKRSKKFPEIFNFEVDGCSGSGSGSSSDDFSGSDDEIIENKLFRENSEILGNFKKSKIV